MAFNRDAGTGFCWGYHEYGGDCEPADFTGLNGVTAIHSGAHAFVALNKNTGKGRCWGPADDGGNCSFIDFTGTTDVYSTDSSFLAINSNDLMAVGWPNGPGSTDGKMQKAWPGMPSLAGVTDVITNRYTFVFVRRGAGTVTCWAPPAWKYPDDVSDDGNDCADLDFTLMLPKAVCAPGARINPDDKTYVGSCLPCAPGKHSATEDRIACESCPPGTFQSVEGQSGCLDCPAGRYNTALGMTTIDKCYPCPLNTYSEVVGVNSLDGCTACPGLPGVALTAEAGATSAAVCQCAAGFFLPEPASHMFSAGCAACSAEALECDGFGGKPIVKPGQYLIGVATTGALTVECPLEGGKTCLGGRASGTDGRRLESRSLAGLEGVPDPEICFGDYNACPRQCSTGHKGFACAQCEAGYARPSPAKSCELCASVGPLVLASLVGLLLVAIRSLIETHIMARAARQEVPAVYTVMYRLFTHYCLTVAPLAATTISDLQLIQWDAGKKSTNLNMNVTNLDFPPGLDAALQGYFHYASTLSELTQAPSMEETLMCVAYQMGFDPLRASTFYWSVLHTPAQILIVLLVNIVAVKIAAAFARPGQETVWGAFNQKATVCGILKQSETTIMLALFSQWAKLLETLLRRPSCGIYPAVDAHGFPTARKLWLQNMDEVCWESEHSIVTLLSYIGVLLNVIVPVAVIAFRINQQGADKYRTESAVRYGYFFTGLHASFWWWELFVKRADIFMFKFIATNPSLTDERLKLLCYAFVSGVFSLLHERYKPYDIRQASAIDFAESLLLMGRTATYFGICILLLVEATRWQCTIVGVAMILVNLLAMGVTLTQTVMDAALSTKEQAEAAKKDQSSAEEAPRHGELVDKLHSTRQTAIAVAAIAQESVADTVNEAEDLADKAARHMRTASTWTERVRRCMSVGGCQASLMVVILRFAKPFAVFVLGHLSKVKQLAKEDAGKFRYEQHNQFTFVDGVSHTLCYGLPDPRWVFIRWLFRMSDSAQKQEILNNIAQTQDYLSNLTSEGVGPGYLTNSAVKICFVLAVMRKQVKEAEVKKEAEVAEVHTVPEMTHTSTCKNDEDEHRLMEQIKTALTTLTRTTDHIDVKAEDVTSASMWLLKQDKKVALRAAKLIEDLTPQKIGLRIALRRNLNEATGVASVGEVKVKDLLCSKPADPAGEPAMDSAAEQRRTAEGLLGLPLQALLDSNNVPAALEQLHNVEKICSPSQKPFVYNNIAYAHLLRGDGKTARDWYEKALERDPKDFIATKAIAAIEHSDEAQRFVNSLASENGIGYLHDVQQADDRLHKNDTARKQNVDVASIGKQIFEEAKKAKAEVSKWVELLAELPPGWGDDMQGPPPNELTEYMATAASGDGHKIESITSTSTDIGAKPSTRPTKKKKNAKKSAVQRQASPGGETQQGVTVMVVEGGLAFAEEEPTAMDCPLHDKPDQSAARGLPEAGQKASSSTPAAIRKKTSRKKLIGTSLQLAKKAVPGAA
eukprot:TRINITY_DN8609_c0_g1_i5.p1 TRINITY_DN8609_c0_g1~~TRINITY_DN8609_c0_g1_i5.p1  ORF type:complete len:1753 (-),score=226.17 TRINITY_DN8609_c0_g1_i5:197-4675(-)